MRKLGLAVIALLVMATVPGFAVKAEIPRASTGQYFKDPAFIGVRQYKLDVSASAEVIVSDDSGVLYGICRMSGTLGDYAAAFDYNSSDSVSTLFAKGGGFGADQGHTGSYIMSPYVYSDEEGVAEVYVQAASVRGCWTPRWPIRFEDGLIGMNNSTSGYTLFFYRLDDGGNPH